MTHLTARERIVQAGTNWCAHTHHHSGENASIAAAVEALRIAREMLLKAGFNLKSASPLQHWAPCGFWKDKACSCPIRHLTFDDLLTVLVGGSQVLPAETGETDAPE